MELKNITLHARAEVLFDGKFIRYTCILPNGKMMICGMGMPGSYTATIPIDTEFEIIDGAIEITLEGGIPTKRYTVGDRLFFIANESVQVTVKDRPCQFVGYHKN